MHAMYQTGLHLIELLEADTPLLFIGMTSRFQSYFSESRTPLLILSILQILRILTRFSSFDETLKVVTDSFPITT